MIYFYAVYLPGLFVVLVMLGICIHKAMGPLKINGRDGS